MPPEVTAALEQIRKYITEQRGSQEAEQALADLFVLSTLLRSPGRDT